MTISRSARSSKNTERDPYFKYTTLLIKPDSLAIANNSGGFLLDSSGSNTWTGTVTGQPAQGSFTPYEPTGYSYYFYKSGYMTVNYNSVLDSGTGDFTFETWLNCQIKTNYQTLYRTEANNAFIFELRGTGSDLTVNFVNEGTVILNDPTSIDTNDWYHYAIVRQGTGSNNFKLFRDGNLVCTNTFTANISSSVNRIVGSGSINNNTANSYNGYLCNLRLTNGEALYSSNFTPSTTPLVANANTSLLTCKSPMLKDDSVNNLAIFKTANTNNTDTGSPNLNIKVRDGLVVSNYLPFVKTKGYNSNSTIGSIYFSGANSTNADWSRNLGSTSGSDNKRGSVSGGLASFTYAQSYTLETWIYGKFRDEQDTVVTNPAIYSIYNRSSTSLGYTNPLFAYRPSTASNTRISWVRQTGTAPSYKYWPEDNWGQFGYNITIHDNVWYHVAVVKDASLNGVSNNCSMYINGKKIGDWQDANTINLGTYCIGGSPSQLSDGSDPSYLYGGYICDLRLSNTVVYTQNFNPPTTPLPTTNNTLIHLKGNNSGITDLTKNGNIITYRTLNISSDQKKYGSGSLYFDGTGTGGLASVTVNDGPILSSNSTFSPSDFTIEVWIYPTSISNSVGETRTILTSDDVSDANGDTLQWLLGINEYASGQGIITFYTHSGTSGSTAFQILSAPIIYVNNWYHVAVCRSNGTLRIFVNGEQSGNYANYTYNFNWHPRYIDIGEHFRSDFPIQALTSRASFIGYIDEIRITRYARYTSNFTVPGPFPTK
jgi:hypothetical protein